MRHPLKDEWAIHRRQFLQHSTVPLAAMALSGLSRGDSDRGNLARSPHLPARAKNIIYLQILGGPSQLDLFDYKPKLQELHRQDVPASVMAGERFAFIKGTKQFLGTPFKFGQHGQSGAYFSELLPHLAGVADELTFIKSMQTDQFNHGPAQIMLATGFATMGKPSMGTWVNYGLGSESKDLPGYVVLVPGARNSGGKAMWGSGFLPARHQGVEFRVSGATVPFVDNPVGVDAATRQATIDAVAALNREHQLDLSDPQLAGSIASYEMAYRMQSSVPGLMNTDDEPKEVLEMYGATDGKNKYARACLLARRLVERGVRFVQVCYEGEAGIAIWDSHGDTKMASLEFGLPLLCRKIDQATAALVRDLKNRGLLESTLIVWGGEFGRTPMNEDRPGAVKGYTGRDHWPKSGTMCLAGGGVKPGVTVGATDELGFHVTEDPVHLHDLNATILHLLGLDHKRLTYRFQGRDFRLTDVHGQIVHKLLG